MSRTRIVALVLAVVLALGFAAAVIIPTLTKSPQRVMVAGDSLAGGYFATTAAQGFRERVFTELATESEIVPLRYGFPHGRLSELAREEIPADLALAVVEVGTNDVGKTPIAEFRAAYDGFIERIESTSPNVRLLCLGVWQRPDLEKDGLTPADYDAEIEASCESAGGEFMQLGDLYIWDGSRGPAGVETEYGVSDAFHPNDLGHERIFKAVMGRLNDE